MTHVNSLLAKDEKCKVGQEGLHNSSSQEDAPTRRSNAGSTGRNLSSDDESDVGVSNLAVSPESYLDDSRSREASKGVSMVQATRFSLPVLISSSVDRLTADGKLEYHVELVELQCPVGSIPMDKSKEGEVVVAHNVDIANNGDLDGVVLPLNAIRIGVEYLDILVRNNHAQIGSSYHGVAIDHHGEDQGSCSSIGKLMRNIEELRKKLGASRARVLEVSYNPGQSLLDGSGLVRNSFELPGVPVISDYLLQNDNPASTLISEEHLVDDVGILGSKDLE
ncbi:hypothetical protein Nepgr_028158 [Nepenthes gracilis]|uniref:Uncharacterized protein n=1 Tax=Nepenthes gracilis TaxID=150966 RepID=A0AAD3T9S9_NEPGR|nr:hypothetical protein Nepgr_028158 [Nepenthes gracilis]